MAEDLLVPAMDPAQLASVERVHGGFLYQHLYLVAVLFCAADLNAETVIADRDEDVEVLVPSGTFYIQVKTRDRPLAPSDLRTFWPRSASLRAAHTTGGRSGSCRFLILANVPPGPSLSAKIATAKWPKDVTFAWPGGGDLPKGLPAPWLSVTEAIAWCVNAARQVPGSRLHPDSLVLKLAALAQYAAAGGAPAGVPHAFPISSLPSLFEQVAQDLHAFPLAPAPYRSHENPPSREDEVAIQLVTGLSGAGKSGWAAQLAMTSAKRHVYFDAAGSAGASLAAALAQQMLSVLLADAPGLVARVYRPGASGLDSIRAIGLDVAARGTEAVIVVDNAHEVDPAELATVVRTAREIRWVLLAQPTPAAEELSARLGVDPEPLFGWSIDTVAAVFADAGAPSDRFAAARVHSLTGGLPLFVLNAAHLAVETYEGDVAALCDDLEQAGHTVSTRQEVLLRRTVGELSPAGRTLLSILAIAGVPLSLAELKFLSGGFSDLQEGAMGQALRELRRWGAARNEARDEVAIHDSFRLPAAADPGLDRDSGRAVRERLVGVLDQSLETGFSVPRARRLLGALAEAGHHGRLAEIMGNESETIQERGLGPYGEALLTRLLRSATLTTSQRFWYLDALSFWHVQTSRAELARPLINEMAQLLEAEDLGARAGAVGLMKQVHLASTAGDTVELARLETHPLVASLDEATRLALRYNIATGLLRAGKAGAAETRMEEIASAYFRRLAIRPADLLWIPVAELARRLGARPRNPEDVKRLADCLDVLARARNRQDRAAGLARIHAVKLYQVVHSYRSAIRTGQDLVEELLGYNDPEGALQFIDGNLLPMVAKLELHEHFSLVLAQRAAVLSLLGRAADAREQLQAVQPYLDTGAADVRAELASQIHFVGEVEAGRIRRPGSIAAPGEAALAHEARVGRNERCRCGSGRKFKRCCGRAR